MKVTASAPSDLVSSRESRRAAIPGAVSRSRARTLPHRGLIGAGGVLLAAAFFTDSAYLTSGLWQWANFSAWLITAGLIVTFLAVCLLLIDLARGRIGLLHPTSLILVAAALALSLFNAFVHSRDAWTSVVPQGILLSAASTILLLIAAARGLDFAANRATGDRS
jgi:uncharacterized membrane protein